MAKSYIDSADDPKRSNDQERFKFDIGEHALILMALAFLSSNVSATHRLHTKMLEFLESLDEELYGDNQDILWRITLARSIGRALLKSGARSLPAIEARVLEDTEWSDFHASFFESYRNDTGHMGAGCMLGNEISDEDVQFIDSYVSTRLRFSYLWSTRNFFREIADRIDASDMGEISVFSDRVVSMMERVVARARHSKALLAQEGQDFATGETTFEAAIRATHMARNKPQSQVRTGVRMLNDMLGGGYEGSRVYVHFGRSGDWKSGMLCAAAFWACDRRFNPRYVTKDPTRKPAVLFVTMENDLFDTIERMVSFALGANVQLRGANVEEIVRSMERAFTSDTCRFIFKYRQSRSISTADLESLIHDEYLRGHEVVMVVQDYIKRIKPVEQFKEARHLELGAVVDDFSGLAKRHNIPVVTGMQLNREAYAKFEAAIKSGRTDAVKELGASNAGESINVFENADVVIFQGRIPVESTGGMYLTVRRAKMRGKRPEGSDFFAQPYEIGPDGVLNEMRLVEDAHLSQRECAGTYDIANGIAREYVANGGADAASPAGREERRAARSGAALSGRSGPAKRRGIASPVPEDAGAARISHEEESDDLDEGMRGL